MLYGMTVTHPGPLTSADVKTALEALGLTHDWLALAAGISPARLYVLVNPDRTDWVPESLATAVREAQVAFDAAADRLATEYLDNPEREYLLRWRAVDQFWAATPELVGWPFQSQGLLLAEVQRRIDTAVRIEWNAA